MAESPQGDYATPYISGLIEEGLSARAGLRAFREAGGRIGNETWFANWNQTVAALRDREAVAQAPLSQRPDRSQLSQWETRSARGYLYQVDALVRGRGFPDVERRPVSFRTDALVTFDEALAGALDHFADDIDAYGEEVIGGVVVNVYEMAPGE